MEEVKQIVEALLLIKEELHDLFWLIFWLAILGCFSTTVNNYRK